jgi:hypothetical protein
MNLTPEQKAIGKQNFDEATGSTRREFLVTIGIVGGTAAAARRAAADGIATLRPTGGLR